MPSKSSASQAALENESFTAAIDQGTTSSRFLIFDKSGTPRANHQVEFPQIYPHSGWIEHDPYDILNSVYHCMEKATEKFLGLGYKVENIKALGITNQRETTVGLQKSKECYIIVVFQAKLILYVRLFGARKRASLYTMLLFGQTLVRKNQFMNCAKPMEPRNYMNYVVCHCPPTHPVSSSCGCFAMSRKFEKHPKKVTQPSELLTHGYCIISQEALAKVYMLQIHQMPQGPCS